MASRVKKGSVHPFWKGDSASYGAIHSWIGRWYGPANHCENPLCLRTSKKFQWAKINGVEHSHNRDHYMQLCIKCHVNYDRKHEGKRQVTIATIMRGRNRGESHGMAKLTNNQAINIRHMRGELSNRKIAQLYGVTHAVINRIMSGKGYRI